MAHGEIMELSETAQNSNLGDWWRYGTLKRCRDLHFRMCNFPSDIGRTLIVLSARQMMMSADECNNNNGTYFIVNVKRISSPVYSPLLLEDSAGRDKGMLVRGLYRTKMSKLCTTSSSTST